MNTRIDYMYRDGSNYKAYTSVVLAGAIEAHQLGMILDALDEGIYFIPSQVGLEDLQGQLQAFDSADELDEDGANEDDHPWHELAGDDFSITEADPTVSMTVAQLAEAFKSVSWDPADPSLPV